MTNAKGVSKRVLILNHNLTGRGTYFRAIKVAECLVNHGFDVTMVSSGSGLYRAKKYLKSPSDLTGRSENKIQFYESANWTLIHGPDGGWSPIGMIWRSLYFLFQDFDLIYTFSHKPVDYFPAWLIHRIKGTKWITDWCDLWGEDGLHQMLANKRGPAVTLQDRLNDQATKWDEKLEKSILNKVDCVTVISEFLKKKTLDQQMTEKKIYKLSSGANTEEIQPLNKSECRQKLGLSEDGFVLGYITNWYPEEDFFLQAVSKVFKQKKDVRLVSTGPEFEKQHLYFDEIETERLHAMGRVPFDKIPLILGASDVLLLPLAKNSFNESRWPHKIGDYMAAGRPVVTCNVGDVAEFVRVFETGIVCEPEPESFSQAILELLNNQQQRNEMSKRAENVSKENMNWEKNCDDFLKYLQDRKIIP